MISHPWQLNLIAQFAPASFSSPTWIMKNMNDQDNDTGTYAVHNIKIWIIGVGHIWKNLCTIVHNNFMNEIHVWRKKPVTTFYIMKWYLKEGFRRKVDFVFFQVAPGNKGPPDGIQTTQ